MVGRNLRTLVARSAVAAVVLATLVALDVGPASAGMRATGRGQPAQGLCTVSWTGNAHNSQWTSAGNWSTHKVPASGSNVCMFTDALQFAFLTGTQTINSLQVSEAMTVIVGSTGKRGKLVVSGVVSNDGNIELTDGDLTAGSMTGSGAIDTQGTDTLTCPAFSLADGAVAVEQGKLTLTDAPEELGGGTISAGEWIVDGTLVVPQDVTSLAGGLITLAGNGAAMVDPQGHNALAGLGQIGAGARLAVSDEAVLATTVALTSAGAVELGQYSFPGGQLSVGGAFSQTSGATLNMSAGTTLAASTATVGAGSSATGEGAIEGNLVNDGFVEALAPLQVSGDYTQSSAATFETYFGDGTLGIAGSAALAGTLASDHIPSPDPGSRAPALTFASATGRFTAHTVGFPFMATATQVDVIARPQIVRTPAIVAPGAAVTVSGGDFQYESTVEVFLDSTSGSPLATATTNEEGAFQVAVTIPATTTAGKQKLIALGTDGRKATMSIKVS